MNTQTQNGNNERIEIFDLDGTLTLEYDPKVGDKTGLGLATYSFWNLITQALVRDAKEFNVAATNWKSQITAGNISDKIESSKDMTEIGIRMFSAANKKLQGQAVRNEAYKITKLFCEKRIVNEEAVKYLEYRLQQGVDCIISTASYEEGAVGFIDGLIAAGLFHPETWQGRILFSGTQTDWNSLRVTHMNVDQNKLLGLETVCQMPIAQIRLRVQAVFGDDPQINDKALLCDLHDRSFVIINAKNQTMQLAPNCVFANWNDIYRNRDQLPSFHASLAEELHNLH